MRRTLQPSAMLVVVLEFLSRPAAQHLWMHDDLEYLAHPYMPVPLRLARWESFKDEDRNVAAAGELSTTAITLAGWVGDKSGRVLAVPA